MVTLAVTSGTLAGTAYTAAVTGVDGVPAASLEGIHYFINFYMLRRNLEGNWPPPTAIVAPLTSVAFLLARPFVASL